MLLRCLLLLVEAYSELGLPAVALPHVTECLSHCQTHHLSPHPATLWLAQLQVIILHTDMQIVSRHNFMRPGKFGTPGLYVQLRECWNPRLLLVYLHSCYDSVFIQLQLGAHAECLELVKGCLIHCNAEGTYVIYSGTIHVCNVLCALWLCLCRFSPGAWEGGADHGSGLALCWGQQWRKCS